MEAAKTHGLRLVSWVSFPVEIMPMCSPIKTPMTPNLKPAAGHTALPWRVWRPQLPTDPLDIVDKNGGDKVCTMAEFDGPANADFIVLACNHHAALVEALEMALRGMTGHSGAPDDPLTDVELEQKYYWIDKARAILATVKGEQVTKTT